MKYLKIFENFTNEEVTFQNPNGKMFATHTFKPEEHLDFCKTVFEWIKKHDKPVMWCLYGNPDIKGPYAGWGESFGLGINGSETFWKKYVSGDKKFSLVEMDDKLIGVLHENGKILMAYDQMDKKVDPSQLAGLEL